jgi:hypothetical protein
MASCVARVVELASPAARLNCLKPNAIFIGIFVLLAVIKYTVLH